MEFRINCVQITNAQPVLMFFVETCILVLLDAVSVDYFLKSKNVAVNKLARLQIYSAPPITLMM